MCSQVVTPRGLLVGVKIIDNIKTNQRLIIITPDPGWDPGILVLQTEQSDGWFESTLWKRNDGKYGAVCVSTVTKIGIGSDDGTLENINNGIYPTSFYQTPLGAFGSGDTIDRDFTDEDKYGSSGSSGGNTGEGGGDDSDSDSGIAALSECTALAPTVAKHTELINNNTAAINELKGKLNNYYTKDEINTKLNELKTKIETLKESIESKLDEFKQQLEENSSKVDDKLDEINNILNSLGDMGVTILTEDGEYVPHTTGDHLCILVGGGGGSFGYGYKLKVTNDLTWYPMQSGVPALVYWFVINLEKDRPYKVTIGKGGVGYSANKIIQDNGLIIYTDESNSGALQTLYNKYYENNTGGNTTFDTYIAYGGRGGVEVIPDNTPCLSNYHALESISAGYRYDDPVSRLYLPKYGCAGTITNTDRAELTMLDEIAHGTNGVAIIIG